MAQSSLSQPQSLQPQHWSVATKLVVLTAPVLLLSSALLGWLTVDPPWLFWSALGFSLFLTIWIFVGARVVVTRPLRQLVQEMDRILLLGGEIKDAGVATSHTWLSAEIRALWTHFLRMHETILKEQRERAAELEREAAAHESLNRRLLELNQVAQMIQQAVSENEVYRTLSHTLHQALPLRQVLILRLNPSEDRLQIVWTWPKREDLTPDAYPVWDNPSRCPVIRSGRDYRVHDVSQDLTCNDSLSNKESGGYWCVPLLIGGRTIGVVHLVSREPHCWTEEARKWVEALINSAAPMIGHLQHLERASRRAMIDELTGAYNRRFLEEFLGKMIVPEERRKGQSISILMIDLDHFKQVNDAFGHQVGDEVLKAIATTLHRSLKDTDVLARYGGEEFTVVLPRTDTPTAAIVAERLRAAVADMSFRRLAPAAPDRLTISIGVATYPSHARTVPELLRCADEALYQAKSLGRNRVVCVCSNFSEGSTHQPLLTERN